MEIEFDPAKDELNRAKHGISLERAIDFVAFVFEEDGRWDYGEVRYRAWGEIDGTPHVLVFTERDGRTRAISLRRAHEKELRRRNVPKTFR